MKKLILFLLTSIANLYLPSSFNAQINKDIAWQKCLGGSGDEEALSIIQTFDSGLAIAGYTSSNDFDVTGNHGYIDAWVVKLKSSGLIEWKQYFGGTEEDRFSSIIQTEDSGFLIVGYTLSNDNDVTGNHGGKFFGDLWVMKLSLSGIMQWQRCLGGTGEDYGKSVIQTPDGGFVILGSTSSVDGDLTGIHDGPIWVVKINATGTIEWQKTFGGSTSNGATIIQTHDDGFAIAGATEDDVIGNHGSWDALVVKLNSTGDTLWQKYFGGTSNDYAYSLAQTSDNGLIIAGSTSSVNGDVSGKHIRNDGFENSDAWIVKLNSEGVLEWQKCIGGTSDDEAKSIIQTVDGGFALAGRTWSDDYDAKGNHGYTDAWIVKMSPLGTVEWQKCLGGSNYDNFNSIVQTLDGSLVLAGSTTSSDVDVIGKHGASDVWIVKLNPSAGLNIREESTNGLIIKEISPNPATIQLRIDYFLSHENWTESGIYNIFGIKVLTKEKGYRNIGTYSEIYDLSSLSSGVYYCNVKSGSEFLSRKIIVQK